jgi:hypothetical protein
MAIWPAWSGLVLLLEEEVVVSSSWGRMRRTRNSRVTPSERDPMTGRGPR